MKKNLDYYGLFKPNSNWHKFILAMKISFFLLFCCLLNIFAGPTYSQTTKISLHFKDATIEEVLNKIEDVSEFYFLYNNKLIDVTRKVNIEADKEPIMDILNDIFNKDINCIVYDRQIILALRDATSISAAMQQLKITGTVTDKNGAPVPGANVVVTGTNQGTMTDIAGKYSIEIPQGSKSLTFSFIGMEPQVINIGTLTQINVTMVESAIGLDEVVVIGYGTSKRSDLVGAVSSISTDKFVEQNISRLDQALQGRATGVQVTSTAGAPGGDVRVRIRGANSALGSNEPLYVIDGFVDADYSTLNPDDIAAIEVLKDASSTSIYGSRGSNGVILITTKRGKKGGIDVNYQGQVSVSNVIGLLDVLNAEDFAIIVNERKHALGLGDVFTQAEINSFKQNGGVDWQKEVYRTALGQQHQLGISGGTEKTTYLISANYLDQQGVVNNTDYKRYTLRSNITTHFSDKLSFRTMITGANTINLNTQVRSGPENPVVQALAWAPTTSIYDSNGDYTLVDPVGSLKPNPLAIMYDSENRVERSTANAIGGLNYEFIKGLVLDLQVAVNLSSSITKLYDGNYTTNFNPTASITNAQQTTLQSTNSLSYNVAFNELHRINAVAVFETQAFKGNYSNANSIGLKFPDLKYDNLGQAESFSVGSDFSKWTLISFLSRINYSLKERYLLSVSIRRDGSSKFYGDNKFSTFAAVGIGWNLAQEDFIKTLEVFSNLKIRGSWGWTGSQAIHPYATQSVYDTEQVTAFNNNNLTSGILLGDPGNKDLKWETTEQKDLGLEIGLFKGRLNSEFDFFIKNTTDLLLNRPVPYYAGGGNFASNAGEIENKGWEFSIGGTIINSNNFLWKSDFNISNVKNTVVSLGGIADQIFTGSNVSAIAEQSEFIYKPGEALGSYWGTKYLGTWKPDEAVEAAKFGNVPGDARYEDLNNDYEIGLDDYQVIGNGIPKISAGLNNTITYRNITFNVFFQGIFGVDKLNYTRTFGLMGIRDAREPILADVKDRYIPGVNEKSDLPAFSNTSTIDFQSSMFLESGDFIRMKNLSLSYNIPASLMQNIGGVKVGFNATNLLTFTKYKGVDPETSSVRGGTDLNQSIDYGSFPNSKTFTLSVDITF